MANMVILRLCYVVITLPSTKLCIQVTEIKDSLSVDD